MGKFLSINYSRVVCTECDAVTMILPGEEFSGLNCTCNVEKAKQFKDIKTYTNGELQVELMGEFKNGDVEVKYTDGSLSYRIARETFDSEYEEVNVNKNIDVKTTESNVPQKGDVKTPVDLSLTDLKDKTVQEIKKEYFMEELRTLARACGMRGVSQTNEDKLIEKLIKKAE